jgi:iron complex outermembrane receptor protein
VLPSLNLNFDLGNYVERHLPALRRGQDGGAPAHVGHARRARRRRQPPPRMWNGSGGNPKLEPWRANSYDLSLETTSARAAMSPAAYFFKDLKNYIYNQQRRSTSPASRIRHRGPDPEYRHDEPAGQRPGRHGARRRAVRSLQLNMLWDPPGRLRHPGQRLRHRKLDPPERSGHQEKLPGLSGVVSNLTAVLREERLLGARQPALSLGLPRRSHRPVRAARLQRDPGREADRPAARLRFEEGPSRACRCLLQVNNLNNSPYQTKQGSPFASGAYAPERYTTYGRQVLLGLNYKL